MGNKELEESLNELDEIEKLMENELKAWEKPQIKDVKLTKPRASIPMVFDVFGFVTPKVQIDAASK